MVFNTPGANANAVKELTVCALLLASRDIVEGSVWTGTLEGNELGVAKAVEKGKSSFAGCEILGKTLGVMGFGAHRSPCCGRSEGARHGMLTPTTLSR